MSSNEPISVMDIRAIKDRIPHRYPMLLVDRLISIDKDEKTAVGLKAVSGNEEFFQGHFPDQPVMPGVLTVEAMAQTAAIFVTETEPDAASKLVYFMSIDRAKFRSLVTPGDMLELHVKLVQKRRAVFKFSGEAKVGDRVAAEADFTAMIVDRDTA